METPPMISWLFLALLFVALAVYLIWRRRPTLAELLPTSHFVEVDGLPLHYLQSGRGPHLVLLHGIGASVYIWRFLIPVLSRHYTVTAFDLPGFGRSAKNVRLDYGLDAQTDRIAQALTKIGIERAHLAGSSMGGAIALWLAKCHPERFPEVACLAPATNPALVPVPVARLAWIAPFFRPTLNSTMMRMILKQIYARHDLITEETVNSYLQPYLDRGDGIRTFVAATALLRDPRLPTELADIQSKVLVLWGQRDRMVPERMIRELAAHLANVDIKVHPDSGHHIMEDEPEWTADALTEFFSTSPL